MLEENECCCVKMLSSTEFNNFLNEANSLDWIQKSGGCEFDEKKVEKLLNSTKDEKDREFVRQVIDRTEYVDFAKFLTSLLVSTSEFLRSVGEDELVIVVVPALEVGGRQESVKSNHWITGLVWDTLREKRRSISLFSYQHAVMKRLLVSFKCRIVMFDDCAYSGHQIQDLHQDFVDVVGKGRVTVVVPYISANAEKILSNEGLVVVSHRRIVAAASIDVRWIYRNESDAEGYVDHKFGYGLRQRGLIYFDHKLADNISVYRSVYMSDGGLFRNNPERVGLDKMQRLWTKRIMKH